MKYKRDGGGYRCDRRMLSTPPLPRDCIIKLKLLFYTGHTIECQERNDDMTIKFPGFHVSVTTKICIRGAGVKRFLDDTCGFTRQYTTACHFYFLNISLASLI